MKQHEVKQFMARLDKWNALKIRRDTLATAIGTLRTISGNFSEIRIVQSLTMSRGDKAALAVKGCEMTDVEIRDALLPSILAKHKTVCEEMEAI